MINKFNTHWVFICGMMSESQPPHELQQEGESPQVDLGDRHIYDIQFAVKVLKKKGVPLSNISILIDYNTPPTISYLENIGTGIKVQEINQFHTVANSKNLDNLVICVYGHGNHDGIDGKIKLKSSNIVSSINSGVKNCVVIFGQCYSGIYNYHDAFLTTHPNICFLGATNFNTSVSSPFSTAFLKDSDLLNDWVANIFMFIIFCCFLWPKDAVDTDGDGQLTLIDLFKKASILTNEYFRTTKSGHPIGIYEKQKRLFLINEHEKIHEYNGTKVESNVSLEKTALLELIDSHYASLHHIQDPWILNRKKAEQIEFDI